MFAPSTVAHAWEIFALISGSSCVSTEITQPGGDLRTQGRGGEGGEKSDFIENTQFSSGKPRNPKTYRLSWES